MLQDLRLNANTTVYKIPRETVFGLRGMVLTDQHFGKTLPITTSIPKFMKTITPIIVREKVNALFFLGDLIHDKEENTVDILRQIVDALEQLPVQVFLMGGNLDRDLFREFKYNKASSNVHIIGDYLMLLENPIAPEGTPHRIFLGHDVGNNIHLEPGEDETFAIELKRTLRATVKPEDYLIIGHGHTFVHNTDRRLMVLREFSLETHHTNYCIITNEAGFSISTIGK